MANTRSNAQKGDPKVGGHPAACSSALHIMTALHLFARSGYDYVANKPHASPLDHSIHYLLNLFLHKDLSRLSLDEANTAMQGLRAFAKTGEYVFQSYHSAYDPDGYRFLPSGTVGIPPVVAGYLAHAYSFARQHNYNVPEAHFWAVIGDSEFREGSLFEAVPDLAERGVHNLTWVVDYNRQSLDGHRLAQPEAFQGGDSGRIADTMRVNGWQVLELRHGPLRQQQFKKHPGLQQWLENEVSDYELQLLLLTPPNQLIDCVQKNKWSVAAKLKANELQAVLQDFGGHDVKGLAQALEQSKRSSKPTCIVAHTLKGWGLKMQAAAGNHSMLAAKDELANLRKQTGLAEDELFARFSASSEEGQFLHTRGQQLYRDVQEQEKIKTQNKKHFFTKLQHLPSSFDINLKLASYPHTQWMLGQLAAKLTRLAQTEASVQSSVEQQWKSVAENMVFMSPDVGTSTNLNATMDGHIFGNSRTPTLKAHDTRTPALLPGQSSDHRFLRFDITEANSVSCVGAYGKLFEFLGVPVLPLMTVYDFFIKRALDQYFYNLYWGSKFILVGTPSGVSLSPEGAQHCWKSDFQIPNQITWEPCFCIELDWILCESIGRLLYNKDQGRSGVLIRGSTRGVQQKDLLKHLRRHKKFKSYTDTTSQPLAVQGFELPGAVRESEVPALSDAEILTHLRGEVLQGAYYLIDYRGYTDYTPGDNVVPVFAMGAVVPEALEASHRLLSEGVYAPVIVVTSPDLLVGLLGHKNQYQYLREGLGGHGLWAEALAGVVSVHDGEPGLLDNIGSILGVPQEALAVRQHSRCGRPEDVYTYHGLDAASIVNQVLRILG